MDDLHELYNDGPSVGKEEASKDVSMEEVQASEADSASESDSDVEFVITSKPGQRAEPPVNKPYAAIKIQKPGAVSQSIVPTKKEPIVKLATVDVDAIAELDGKSILSVDLESLEQKPWRLPGADITEYFNYGFDEFTWTAYCQKQATLRKDYTPGKVMQNMMGAMDPTMMGMMGGPPMMMPPMDPSLMYGAMPMDFMSPNQPAPMQARGPPPGIASSKDAGNANRLHSPAQDQVREKDDGHAMLANNIPKGPSASQRGNYRPRTGASRW